MGAACSTSTSNWAARQSLNELGVIGLVLGKQPRRNLAFIVYMAVRGRHHAPSPIKRHDVVAVALIEASNNRALCVRPSMSVQLLQGIARATQSKHAATPAHPGKAQLIRPDRTHRHECTKSVHPPRRCEPGGFAKQPDQPLTNAGHQLMRTAVPQA